ncbi:ATP-dependent DNA helicase [Spectribacter hydrogenoxidans]|uniref:ATP-dependent DNA helicase n=1 Tax=Spectribacter hydrogenoxidans TaxID=3075608 RepID=A0ABU3C0Z5_9GAMM|nr:ATP-dependent DNA helicase [Salinisphaera sp. W335]MDT0635180.1 ATP-dependent DNA helicase [Salinisphaera sp. W335]
MSISSIANKATYAPAFSASVRAFCAFVARRGDLDHRFTPSPTAAQGMAGHAAVARRRPGDYHTEVPITGIINGLRLSGRIDGVAASPLAIEEIKTFRGRYDRIPENHRALHRAQLETYGALYCREHRLTRIELRLVYYDVDHRQEHVEPWLADADALEAALIEQADCYLKWADAQADHVRRRNAALRDLTFPHAQPTVGQAQLMTAVDTAIREQTDLLAQAPTGVGKTLGTLYPALAALGNGQLDRLLYLTAKTSAQQEAVKALDSLAVDERPLPLRRLVLAARDRACEHPDKACHGQSCPLARGFFDRLPAARQAAAEHHELTPLRLKTIAAAHRVCPYYLGQEMAHWSDVVIGDYHYYFDQSALLHALTREYRWRVAVLVDEAHNLIDRARTMYSAALDQAELRAAAAGLPGAVRPALQALDRALSTLEPSVEDNINADTRALPTQVSQTLTSTAAAITAYLAHDPDGADQALLEICFAVLALLRLTEAFGPHSFCDITRTERQQGLFRENLTRVAIDNVVPGPHLAPRLNSAVSVIAFSATLSPVSFYQRMLGFEPDVPVCDAPSAFRREQLQVRHVTDIPTAPAMRRASAAPIAALIGRVARRRPGNYLVCFSSFAYLRTVADTFERDCPEVSCCRQTPAMSDRDRRRLLAAFEPSAQQVVFAVLGGVFSEGIDLPGDRLVGAFIVTLGLPAFDDRNQRTARRIETLMGAGEGYRFTYLYPGLRKVVQAAGRVIRSTRDEGSVWLIDPRWRNPDIQCLMPPHLRASGP